ncbi:thiol S-methyltransferase TMT1A-like [Ornithodoros turicata]|uniref:thiol S-methyltransferase TMT1A-like n=1 Tax=Ornithodoros turicata TaxID=34597 RepID=UPI00313A367B
MNLQTQKSVRIYMRVGVPLSIFIMCILLRKRVRTARRLLFAWIYSRYFANSNAKTLAQYKRQLFSTMREIKSCDESLRGKGHIRIVEIGIGTGTNLEYYPEGCRLISVEPNSYFESLFKKNRNAFPGVVVEKFVRGSAEDMSAIPSGSVDCVVSTLVLCSVDDLANSIREVKRILVEGGHFYYIEHVGYERGTWANTLQRLVEPFWSAVSDGCQLTRETSLQVDLIGFRAIRENLYFPEALPYVARPILVGVAVK